MEDNNINHSDMTKKQRELFKELNERGRPNTMEEPTLYHRDGRGSREQLPVLSDGKLWEQQTANKLSECYLDGHADN